MGRHVLIVDDEQSVRFTLEAFLTANCDATVHTAPDSQTALRLLEQHPVDVAVCDIVLPDMNGVELLQAIRDAAPDVKVIMITGHPTVDTTAESLRAGAFDFLLKPLRKEGFLQSVSNALRFKALEEENVRYREQLERLVFERTAKLRTSQRALRALSARLAEIQEIERQGLCRELHDQFGQALTALGINLTVVRKSVITEPSDPAIKRLEEAIDLVEQLGYTVRDIMCDLRPPLLDDYGLLAALRWYADQFQERTELTTNVTGRETEPRLPPTTEVALFRISQEALTNIAKHANANRVTVSYAPNASHVVLDIADDGMGFDPDTSEQTDVRTGWGLQTMRDRALAVGGRLRVHSARGAGSRVTVEVPLPGKDDPEEAQCPPSRSSLPTTTG